MWGSDISQKKVLKILSRERTYNPNPTQLKVTELLDLDVDDWTHMLKSSTKHSRYTRSKAKLFEIWAGIAYANTAYKRFGHKNEAKCSFCNEERQNYIHLFIHCVGVNQFREKLRTKWDVAISKAEWFTSKHDNPEIAFLIRESLVYIHRRNWEDVSLSTDQFEARIRSLEKIEANIAERKHNLFDHLVTWEPIMQKVNL